MSGEVWNNIKLIAISAAILAMGVFLSKCSTTNEILAGSTHACGTMHVEGYFTDTQGEVVVVKAPIEWTADQIRAFCSGE